MALRSKCTEQKYIHTLLSLLQENLYAGLNGKKPMNWLINLLSIAAVSSDFHERFPDFGDEAGEDRRYAGYKLVSGGKYQSLQLPRVQVIDSQLYTIFINWLRSF